MPGRTGEAGGAARIAQRLGAAGQRYVDVLLGQAGQHKLS